MYSRSGTDQTHKGNPGTQTHYKMQLMQMNEQAKKANKKAPNWALRVLTPPKSVLFKIVPPSEKEDQHSSQRQVPPPRDTFATRNKTKFPKHFATPIENLPPSILAHWDRNESSWYYKLTGDKIRKVNDYEDDDYYGGHRANICALQ